MVRPFVAVLSRDNGTETRATAERVTERDRNARKDLAYGSKKHTRTTKTQPRAHINSNTCSSRSKAVETYDGVEDAY
jgi:hypothetical protein